MLSFSEEKPAKPRFDFHHIAESVMRDDDSSSEDRQKDALVISHALEYISFLERARYPSPISSYLYKNEWNWPYL